MIQKYIGGRLGNQFFQYAALRAFQINNNIEDEKILLNFSYIYKNGKHKGDGRYDQLMYFNTADYEIGKIHINIFQIFLICLDNFICKLIYIYNIIFIRDKKRYTCSEKVNKFQIKLNKIYNKFGLYRLRLGYCDFKNYNNKNKLFSGNFESPRYFQGIRDVLLDEFTPKYDILAHNVDLYNDIKNSESVCISIRRGDFLDKSNRGHFYVCTPEYFYRGIKYVQNKIPNAKFFVFSDDIQFCKNNMKFPKGTKFERGDDPVWEKLRLMYSCKHFIISNSTFSRWAQYLSRNDKKLVIAPSRWCNDDFCTATNELYDKQWILINPDCK